MPPITKRKYATYPENNAGIRSGLDVEIPFLYRIANCTNKDTTAISSRFICIFVDANNARPAGITYHNGIPLNERIIIAQIIGGSNQALMGFLSRNALITQYVENATSISIIDS